MNNYQFLRKYQELQKGIMSDKLIDLDFARVTYSKGDESVFWNYALVDKVIGEEELKEIEDVITSMKRKPAMYFEDKKNMPVIVDFLKKRKYKFAFEDSWMFHDGENIDTKYFSQVRKVKNDKQLQEFLRVFDASYTKGDPQNAYGELGDYLKVAEKVWKKHSKTNRLEYFFVYKDNKPVAVSTLTNFENLGYISNVGSLKDVRGEGFGKAATLYCVNESVKKGNKKHFLATEEGTYANDFYKRIGFTTKFTAFGYAKEE